jgi:hypothetical protein
MDITTGAVVIAGLKYVGPHAGKVVADFTAKIFMPAGEALGEVLAFPIVEWQKRRAARAEALIQDAAVQLYEAGVEPIPVPGRVLMPLLQSGSLEEDEGLRRKWASLLAQAASSENAVPPGFVSILADLSPLEVRILDRVHGQAVGSGFADIGLEEILDGLDDEEGAPVAIENIERLGLWRRKLQTISPSQIKNALETTKALEGRPAAGWAGSTRFNRFGDDIVVDEHSGLYAFTTLGDAFVKACTPKAKATPETPPHESR